MILSVSKPFSPFKVGIYCPLQQMYFQKFDNLSSKLSVVGSDSIVGTWYQLRLIEVLNNISLSK